MATEITLSAQARDTSIKRCGRRTLEEGLIPGVVYGPKTESFGVKCDLKDLHGVLTTNYGRNAVIALTIDGSTYNCMVKETQFDVVKRSITHVDFYVVEDEQPVTLDVPVEPVGTSAGEKLGGLMQVVSRTIKVNCKVKDIPPTVQHDVTEMDLGDALYIDEIAAPEGCEIFFKNRFPVIRVAVRRGALVDETEEAEGEEAAAPEA
ncbi:MAG: large subunit ribosomal protein L25 [Bradymonadia bacterium]|jgi:large subunit ribosomal protein L25